MKKILMAVLLGFCFTGLMFAKSEKKLNWKEANYEVPAGDKTEASYFTPIEDGWAEFTSEKTGDDFSWVGPKEIYYGFEGALKYMTGPGLVGDSNGLGFVFDMMDNDYKYIKIKLNGDKKGSFYVGEKVSGSAKKIQDWTESDSINIGYREVNVIRVEANGKNKDIYINDVLVYTFENPKRNSGRVKYIAQIDKKGFLKYCCKFLKFQTK